MLVSLLFVVGLRQGGGRGEEKGDLVSAHRGSVDFMKGPRHPGYHSSIYRLGTAPKCPAGGRGQALCPEGRFSHSYKDAPQVGGAFRGMVLFYRGRS